jgi:hypothetical protein
MMNAFNGGTMISGRRYRMAAAAAAILVLAGGCGQKSSVVLEDPLRNVARTESNTQTLMAWTDAGVRADVLVHIDGSDDMAVFPTTLHETIENTADHLERKNSEVINRIATIIEPGGTVNIGYKAGMYDRVIWVLPSPGSVSDIPLENFKQVLMAKRGFPAAELEDFAFSGRQITGTISGIPVTITSLEDLELTDERALLDIDLVYFTGLQAVSKDYEPGTAALLNFLRALKRKRIPAVMATINRSSINNQASLDIRYYADIITEVLADPSKLEGATPGKYQMMIDAEKALRAGRYSEAAALYAGLTKSYPYDAGLHFSHAFALGFLDKGEETRDAMVRAYGIDQNYLQGFFQLARVLGSNGRIAAGEALLETSDLKKTLPEIEMDYQRGLFYFQAGLHQEAVGILSEVAAKRQKDFAVRTVLYKAYEELGQERRMYSVLEDLVDIDLGRVERDMPWALKKLGDLAWSFHLDYVASVWYEHYLELVPGDPDSARMQELIDVYEGVEMKTRSVD